MHHAGLLGFIMISGPERRVHVRACKMLQRSTEAYQAGSASTVALPGTGDILSNNADRVYIIYENTRSALYPLHSLLQAKSFFATAD